MPVRKTESRLPAGFSASDLGSAATAAGNANVHLISYLSSPVVKERMQHYVVIVDDAALAPTVGQYDWSINNNGTVTTLRTDHGILEFTPPNPGTLNVTVNVLNAAGATLLSLSLQQTVAPPFEPLEQRIDEDEATSPNAAHPETSRELINDLRRYADALAPPASDDLLDRLMLSIAYSVTLRIPQSSQVVRNTRIENAAREINNGNHANFLSVAENGIGVCEVKPHILAMCLNKTGTTPYIPFTAIPASGGARNTALGTVRTAFNALPETDKIDLFNLLRFPKSHFRMCKTVLERLRDHFFAGQVMQTLLATNANAERLLTGYQEHAIRARIRGMMRNPVWAHVPPLPAGGGGAAGTPPAPGAPPNIGSFEKVPQLTFVAAPSPTDNGFIAQAFAYHETYGLAPQTVPSFQDILTRLSTPTTALQRIRIVSHFSLEEHGFISAIMMPFFTGQATRQTEWWHFKFGVSDEEGLKAFFEDRLSRNTYNFHCDGPVRIDPADANVTAPLWQAVLMKLRAGSNAAALLNPFSIRTSQPTGQLLTFIKYCCDLFMFSDPNVTVNLTGDTTTIPMPALVKTFFQTFLNQKIAELAPVVKTGSRTEQQVTDLRDAIVAVRIGQLPFPFGNFTISRDVGDSIYLLNHNAFRTTLTTVRGRFGAGSFVDIRGCRVGQDARYMNAVRDFFSQSATVKPTVSAPEWFQSFTLPGTRIDGAVTGNPTPDQEKTLRENTMRGMFTGGGGGFTTADVQREYATWSGRIGIPAHIAFWQRLTAGDPLEFLEYAWKDQIPALAMDPVRLRGFNALAYPAAVARLAEIFNLLSPAIPAPADLATFATTLLPHIPALRTAERGVNALTASSPPADLTASNTAVQAVATSMGQTLPAAPAPLTLTYLQTCITQLKTHATTHPNIAPFLAAIQTKVTAPSAGFMYMLFAGMPLFVQAAADEETIRYILLQAVREEAMRSFMRVHWADPLPAGSQVNTLTPNFNGVAQTGTGNGIVLTDLGRMLQLAALSDDRATTHFAANPNFEYHQHIKSVP